jgi:two-component system chemotaxis response regulator CheB
VKAVLNAARLPRDVVVIGASAGGVEALIHLLAKLPADVPARLAVVLHRSPYFETRLPQVLGRRAVIPVLEPATIVPFEPSHVYVAPRDLHLLVNDGLLRLERGPKEHRTRPAIDPLFATAARAYGPRVVGVLLTGRGADGVSGLITIKAAGGISLVQDPGEAPHPTLPATALVKDDVDAALPLNVIAEAIVALAAGEPFDITSA